MSSGEKVFVSLGANLDDCRANFRKARELIDDLDGTSIQAGSEEKLTAAVGVTDQPDFLNQVILINTDLTPRELLNSLLKIEREMGRVRTERWGPRLIDLDILFYGSLRLEEPGLVIPHPELIHRPFFIEMIAELDNKFLSDWPEFARETG